MGMLEALEQEIQERTYRKKELLKWRDGSRIMGLLGRSLKTRLMFSVLWTSIKEMW